MKTEYLRPGPSRAQIDAMPGCVVVEFGTSWCGYCRAAQPLVEQAFAGSVDIAHVRIEDGKGVASGRSYGVKLWPTLIFLRDGQEVARLVRPADADAVGRALARLAAPTRPGD